MTFDPSRDVTMKQVGNLPLCVSVDGALVRTSLFTEALLRLLGTDLFTLFRLPIWLLKGRSNVERKVASRVRLDGERLPYNEPLLEFLREEQAGGREIVLVTSAPEGLVNPVMERLGFSARVMGSGQDGRITPKKLGLVLAERYGPKGFDFVGDPGHDGELWENARQVILAGTSVRDGPDNGGRPQVGRTFLEKPLGVPVVLEAMRVHQWLKNTLIFLPLLANQSLDEPRLIFASLLAFVAFSLSASGVYLLNDLLDLDADRRHPTKRHRPLAAGRLSPSTALGLVLLLEGVAIVLSATLLPLEFLGVLFGYLVITTAYSLRLKGAVLIDVLLLAGLYTLRVVAGAAATGITPSMWLLAFSMFLFLSLALVKRYAELFALISAGSSDQKLPARSYRKEDLHSLVSMGTASGYLSVLVLALYIVSDEAALHYSESYLIWLVCPLLLYWISRAWIVVGRDEMHEDPLIWAVRDQISRWVALIAAIIVLVAQ